MLALWVGLGSIVGILGLWLVLSRRSTTSTPRVIRHKRNTPKRVLKPRTGKRYLVTGGHGYLGSHIVEGLLARGEKNITVLDVNDSHLFKGEEGITFVKGSILDTALLAKVCKDIDTVFHTAAIINFWERLSFQYPKFYSINVKGTENLLKACQKAGVKQFIHTSSSVVAYTHTGRSKPIHMADESVPFPKDYVSHYSYTKRLAENVVLSSNGKEGLLTAAVRAGSIFGPRDALVTAVFMEEGGQFGVPEKQDFVYVENIVHGMYCIEQHLTPNSEVGGQVYYLTNGEPVTITEFARRMAKHFGEEVKELPYWLMFLLAHFAELVARLTYDKIRLGKLSNLTPASIYQSGEFYFSDAKAKKQIGYTPIYPLDEAIDISAAYVKQFRGAKQNGETSN